MKVALIGRPNVGKSTLFNRLVGRPLAIVDDRPGVTRDRKEGEAKIGDLTFTVIDTAGVAPDTRDALSQGMNRQSEKAAQDADLIFFIADAIAGVTSEDKDMANWLRHVLKRHGQKPVVTVVNKSESRQALAPEAFNSLGFAPQIAISAEHGLGVGDIYDVLLPFYAMNDVTPEEDELETESEVSPQQRPLKLAIVGRPNVGKSTLINALLGEDRQLTGPEAGVTRDAITIPWTYEDRPIQLVDTAGQRRQARVQDPLESRATRDARRATEYAEVVVLVLDAENALEKQDLTLAQRAADEGRAVVIALNKWDKVQDKRAYLKEFKLRLEEDLPQLRGVDYVTVSALKRANLDALMDGVFAAYARWNRRLPTNQLNRWLQEMTARHSPPLVKGRPIRLKFMTQNNSRPPTFVIFATRAEQLPVSYHRYLINGLREHFKLSGVPIRLFVRQGHNPFADKVSNKR